MSSTAPATASAGDQIADPDPGSGMRSAAWVSLAGAAALLAGAGVGWLVSDSNAAIYNDDARCFYGGLTRDQRCGGYRDVATTARTLAIVEVGAAGAATVLSAVLFVRAPKSGTRSQAIRCTLGVGVECGGSF